MIAHFNQPRFIPALNYVQRMEMVDIFVFRDDVQFQRKDWENRNKIKIAGEPGWMWLTAPVKACAPETRITEVEIDDTLPWRTKMCRAIELNYARAPFFKQFFPYVRDILLNGWKGQTLVSLNYAFIDMLRDAWRLGKCKFLYASELGCSGDTDEILIAMCKKLGADVYLSGAEGRNYNRPERWAEEGIELRYHDYVYPEYPQLHGPFVPWMSALDLLFNCGRDGCRYLEAGHEKEAAAKLPLSAGDAA